LIVANVALFVLVNIPLGLRPPDLRDPEFVEYVQVTTEALDGRVSPREVVREASAYDVFVFTHGFRPAAPRLSDLFFCMFLHGGLLHLAGNMLFLWIYGDNVERRLGGPAFLLWYLATGAAATLFHMSFASDSPIPLVGASGAISGVLGFYFLWFPRNRVRMLLFLPPFIMQVFELPARIVLGLYLIADNLLPFLLAGEGGGVAHGAHIGGFFAGLAGAWFMDRRVGERSPIGTGTKELWDRTRGALPVAEALRLAHSFRAAGQSAEALAVLRRALRNAPGGRDGAEAYALAGFIHLEDRAEPTAAYQYLLTALELDSDPELVAQVRRALLAIDALQKRPFRSRRPAD
jgi:membrane associated rhomboid family serine protease